MITLIVMAIGFVIVALVITLSVAFAAAKTPLAPSGDYGTSTQYFAE